MNTQTHAEQLQQIALDFRQFTDGDTQLAIGATFDKPLTERIRIVLKEYSGGILPLNKADDLREELEAANEEIKENETIIKKQDELIADLEAKIKKLEAAARTIIA